MDDRLPRRGATPAREQLDFLGAARPRFLFLVELGYEEVRAERTYVRFERGDRFVEVFHGRASYELGVEFGRRLDVDDAVVEQKFHIRDVLAVLAPEVTFTARTATTPDQLVRFVDELAGSARLAVERFDRGGDETFDRISDAVQRQSDRFLDGVRASRLRARAQDAWHRKDFASVITAYEEIHSELDTVGLRNSEIKRLRYARDHLDG